jgi:hypothetical protein
MVDFQDPKEEEKKAQKKSRQAWLTAGGFQVWGLQSSTGSSQQDLKLPPIRELNEVFREEQGLKSGVLRDVLPSYSLAALL